MEGGCGLERHLLANALNGAVIPTQRSAERLALKSPFVSVRAGAGLCATQIIQLNYAVILNYASLKRQDIIKTANMVENYIKLRQDKVDYVLD